MDPITLIFGLALMVASYAIQALIAPKATKPTSASLKDFDFPQVTEGTPQSVVFGDVWISDWCVLWFGNMRTSNIKSKGGKKG